MEQRNLHFFEIRKNKKNKKIQKNNRKHKSLIKIPQNHILKKYAKINKIHINEENQLLKKLLMV